MVASAHIHVWGYLRRQLTEDETKQHEPVHMPLLKSDMVTFRQYLHHLHPSPLFTLLFTPLFTPLFTLLFTPLFTPLFTLLLAACHRPAQSTAERGEAGSSEDQCRHGDLEPQTAETLQELQQRQVSPEDYCHGTLASAVSLLLGCLSREAPALQGGGGGGGRSDLMALLLGLVSSVTEVFKIAVKRGNVLAEEQGQRSGVSLCLLHSLLNTSNKLYSTMGRSAYMYVTHSHILYPIHLPHMLVSETLCTCMLPIIIYVLCSVPEHVYNKTSFSGHSE